MHLPPGALHIGEIAEILGVSTETVRRWIREDQVNGYARTTGGWRYWKVEDVPILLLKVAKMIAARKSEKRNFLEVYSQLVVNWEAYCRRKEMPSGLPPSQAEG